MEISQYIRDLLYTHDRVILSGFGAFSAKYSPSQVDEDTNTMQPPSKEIVFDGSITENDNLLENHMAEKQDIPVEDARKQIDEYVKTVKSKLNAGKEVKFLEIGIFSISEDNTIDFLYEPSGNLLLDTYGMEEVPLPEDKKKKRGIAWIIFTSIAAILIILLLLIYFFRPNVWDNGKNYVVNIYQNITQKDKTDKDTEKNKNDKNNKTDENTKNKSDKNKDNENDKSGLADVDELDKNKDKNDKNKSDKDKKDGNISDDETIPVSSDDDDIPGQYKIPEKNRLYLIVGSLESSAAAEKEKTRLAKIGIKTEIIPVNSTKYRLSIGNYANIDETVTEYNNFHLKHESIEVWLWENK